MQHFMRALVAPRVMLNTEGEDDRWANPLGAQAAWQAAQPVFDFLGVPKNNLYHTRPGGHAQSLQAGERRRVYLAYSPGSRDGATRYFRRPDN